MILEYLGGLSLTREPVTVGKLSQLKSEVMRQKPAKRESKM